MKVDPLPPQVPPADATDVKQAFRPPEQASPHPASSQEPDVIPNIQPSSEVVVSYHFTEPGRHLYFQVLDQKSGKLIREVPPADIRREEQEVDEYLDSQAKQAEDKRQKK